MILFYNMVSAAQCIAGIGYAVTVDNVLGTRSIVADVSGASLPTASNWYIDAILLKLEPTGLTGVSLTSSPTGKSPFVWNATTSASRVDLQKFSSLLMDGFTLIYFTGIVVPSAIDSSRALVNSGGPIHGRLHLTRLVHSLIRRQCR